MRFSPCQPRGFVFALALLLAAGALLLPASGAQAASKRGAVLVKDISPGHPKRASSSSGPSELTNVAGTLFFTAYERRHGYELWRSDGTRRGTRMVKDIRRGRAFTTFGWLTAVGRKLYFVKDDGTHGRELWRSDGTARGTRMVKDITPGNGSTNVESLTEVAGTLFFVVRGTAVGEDQLWRSDGTEPGTTLVKKLQLSGSNDFTAAVGDVLYFSASDGIHGQQLWRSDGTASGTVMVAPSGPSGPTSLTNVAGTLYFVANDGGLKSLWRSDGTEAGTTLVKELQSGFWLTAVGRTLYFATVDYSANSQLWRSDGTEAGTTPITYLGVTPQGDGFYPQLTAVGDVLYFVRNEGLGALLRTDGTPGGTKLLGSDLRPGWLTAVGKELYFVSTVERRGQELWRSDGTRKGTRLVRDIRPGRRSGRPRELTAVGKTLFFSAHDYRHGTELWRAGAKPCKRVKGKCKQKR